MGIEGLYVVVYKDMYFIMERDVKCWSERLLKWRFGRICYGIRQTENEK